VDRGGIKIFLSGCEWQRRSGCEWQRRSTHWRNGVQSVMMDVSVFLSINYNDSNE
jgi:hypothetical protein